MLQCVWRSPFSRLCSYKVLQDRNDIQLLIFSKHDLPKIYFYHIFADHCLLMTILIPRFLQIKIEGKGWLQAHLLEVVSLKISSPIRELTGEIEGICLLQELLNEWFEALCTTGTEWWSERGCKLLFYYSVGDDSRNWVGIACCLPLGPSWRNHLFVHGQCRGARHQWCNCTIHSHSFKWIQSRSGLASSTITRNKYAGPGHLDEHPSCRDSCSSQAMVPPRCLGETCSRCLEQLFISRRIQKRAWKTECCVVLHCAGWGRQLSGWADMGQIVPRCHNCGFDRIRGRICVGWWRFQT